MILETVPIRTPCCCRLAMLTAMTVIDFDSPYHDHTTTALKQQTLCPHCASVIDRNKGQRIRVFQGRMKNFIFAGIPKLLLKPSSK